MRISEIIKGKARVRTAAKRQAAKGLPLIPKTDTPETAAAAFKKLDDLARGALESTDLAVILLSQIDTQFRILGRSEIGQKLNKGPDVDRPAWFEQFSKRFVGLANDLFTTHQEIEKQQKLLAANIAHLKAPELKRTSKVAALTGTSSTSGTKA